MKTSLPSVIVYGLLASLAAATPSRIEKRHFKVVRARNPNFKGYNGPRELYKAYSKFSMPVPPALMDAIHAQGSRDGPVKSSTSKATAQGVEKAANLTGVGLVTATPEQGDIEYLCPVTIGGQTLNLDFDTGSSDLWVFSTKLPKQAQTGHQIFDPAKSKTFKAITGASFSLSYGDGSGASGIVGTDIVDIGGASFDQQAVELATKVSDSFVKDTANNGLLGLAFSNINSVKPQQQKTFFDNVKGNLAEPLFTADLRKSAVGAYEFGRVDSTKFTGPMSWVSVNASSGFWQFSTSKFAIGDGAAKTVATGQAIADTGTTLMLVSADVVNGYFSKIPGAVNDKQIGGITLPCDSKLPDLMVDVGGAYMAKIKGSDIILAQVQGNTCFSGIQVSTIELQIWGDIFFKSQFVAFNGGNTSLGLAPHI